MMTKEEQLAYCDHLDGRLAALNASAKAFVYPPNFAIVPHVWDIPHPYEDYPPTEWDRVFFASVGAGVTLACFAIMIALVKV